MEVSACIRATPPLCHAAEAPRSLCQSTADLDIFFGCETSSNAACNRILLNAGNGLASSFTEVTSGAILSDGSAHGGFGFADIDNDDDLDAVVGQLQGQRNGYTSSVGLRMYTNDGTGTFTQITNAGSVSSQLSGSSKCVAWGDLDGVPYPRIEPTSCTTHSDSLHMLPYGGRMASWTW